MHNLLNELTNFVRIKEFSSREVIFYVLVLKNLSDQKTFGNTLIYHKLLTIIASKISRFEFLTANGNHRTLLIEQCITCSKIFEHFKL